MPLARRALLFGGCALCAACAGTVTERPAASPQLLSAAEAEIARAGRAPRRDLSDAEAAAIFQRVGARLTPAAQRLCREMGPGAVCEWRVGLDRSREVNAYAGPGGVVVLHKGVIETARNDDEVALVLGHEMGHQIANHIGRGQQNAALGSLAGALVGGLLGAGLGMPAEGLARTGGQLGGTAGRLYFSKEQEREADFLAARAMRNAGFDLRRGRGFLVTLAALSGPQAASFLATHPAGPDRLASFDAAVATL
jgi:predicted Zn-dependent protease